MAQLCHNFSAALTKSTLRTTRSSQITLSDFITKSIYSDGPILRREAVYRSASLLGITRAVSRHPVGGRTAGRYYTPEAESERSLLGTSHQEQVGLSDSCIA